MSQQNQQQFLFLNSLAPKRQIKRIPSIPLQFQSLTTDIIAKELTKLNNPHPYRIHYLGPRPHHSYLLHKRYGQQSTQQPTPQQGYQLNLRSIVSHCFTNRQQLQGQTQCFYRAFEGMNPTLKGEDCYVFDGAFEGGNLDCAIKICSTEFDLFLRVDSNSRGHTGWFYFSVKNGAKKEKVKLNICNLKKHPKLYQQGMNPFVYSSKAYQQSKVQWTQDCSNLTLDHPPFRYNFIYQRIDDVLYNRLSFQYQFKYDNDEVFFAYCVPYTYSKLQNDIRAYSKSEMLREYSLGLSLTGLQVPLLHITDFSAPSPSKNYAIITGRVHPSESNSSHMVHGFISWLIGNSREAELVRKELHFFVIPMINPDGVVLGNNRTSVSGKDLNREFTTQNSELFPQVLLVKNLVSKLQKTGKTLLYIDFHGHSMRKNTFLYGPNYSLTHSEFLRCRLLPRIIEKVEPSFRYYSCSFTIGEQKRKTARANMLQQMRIPYVYTIQSSNGLFYDPNQMKTVPFTEQLWNQMGKSIAKAIAIFNNVWSESQSLLKQRKQSREAKKREKTLQFFDRKLSHQRSEEHFELSKKPSESHNSYNQLINQIKMLVQSERKADDQVDSDDYDQNEDISTKKLCSFTQSLHNYKRQSLSYKQMRGIQAQKIDFESIAPCLALKFQEYDDSQYKQGFNIQGVLKDGYKKRLYEKRRKSRVMKSVENSQSKKLTFDRLTEKKSAQTLQSKKSISVSLKKQAAPLTLYPQKPRYSLVNSNNIFPLQSKLQTLHIAKDLRILRRQMKKGRLLISNLEESRLKFVSIQQRQSEAEQKRRTKQQYLKAGKVCRPSTSCIKSAKVDLNQQVKLTPNQPYLHGFDNFISVNGEQTGLTIKPLKRKY